VFWAFGIWPGGGIIGAIIVAFVGAIILVWDQPLAEKSLSEVLGALRQENGNSSGGCLENFHAQTVPTPGASAVIYASPSGSSLPSP